MELAANSPFDRVRIFSDSQSAIKAVNSAKLSNETTIIRNLGVKATAGGTRTELHWIPSHVGIQENEKADRLANEARALPLNDTTFGNIPLRDLHTYRHNWSERLTAYLNNLHSFFESAPRSSLRPDPWLTHGCRRKNSLLHRLRTNRTRLNGRLATYQATSPNCPNGCTTAETTKHAIPECPHYEAHRRPLKKFPEELDLSYDTNTLVKNPALAERRNNFEIRNLLLEYLRKTKLEQRM